MAAYVGFGYVNGDAVRKLEHAIKLLDAAAQCLPLRDDLPHAAWLLREVLAELVVQ
jgi:hypothetical protein